MRQSQRHEILVGAFVLAALALLFAMTFVIRGSTGMNPYQLKAQFSNVTGLEISSPVLVQGFRLGRVTGMEAGRTEDEEPTVIVSMKISRTIPIYKDAVASLAQQGFIGDKQVEIFPGSPEQPEVEPGAFIEAEPPMDMNAVFAKAGDVMENLDESLNTLREFTTNSERLNRIDEIITNINRSSAELDAILTENRAAVKTTVENVRQVSERTLEVADRVDKVAGETDARLQRIGTQVEEAITEFRQSSDELAKKLDKILADADGVGKNANELLVTSREEVERVSENVQKVSDNLNKILEQINAGEGTVGKLVQDPRPFEDLRESVAALRNVLSEQKQGFYNREIQYRELGASESNGGGGEN